MDDLAAILNTIPYELTCAVSKRVPRLYLENGQVVERTCGCFDWYVRTGFRIRYVGGGSAGILRPAYKFRGCVGE